jgi:soluble lytic murein transglycosylase-like protein
MALQQPTAYVAAALEAAGHAHGIDPAVLRAIAWVESRFNPNAIGPKVKAGWQAQGLMQLGPAARIGVTDPLDAKQNALAGAKLLAGYLRRYNQDLPTALAAYNWGPGNVDKHPDEIPGEVREYVDRVTERLALELSARLAAEQQQPPPLPPPAAARPALSTICPHCGQVLRVLVNK